MEVSRWLRRKPVGLCSESGSVSGTAYPMIWRFQVLRPPYRTAVAWVRPCTAGKSAVVLGSTRTTSWEW